jgi:hypothetical protein
MAVDVGMVGGWDGKPSETGANAFDQIALERDSAGLDLDTEQGQAAALDVGAERGLQPGPVGPHVAAVLARAALDDRADRQPSGRDQLGRDAKFDLRCDRLIVGQTAVVERLRQPCGARGAA